MFTRRPDFQNLKTRPMAVRQVGRLVGLVAALQFGLNTLDILFPDRVMFYLWILGTFVAAWAGFHSEILKGKRGG